MKKTLSLTLLSLLGLGTTSFVTAQKSINRIINNSNDYMVTIAPVAAPTEDLVQSPAYTVYMKSLSGDTFDVTLTKPIEIGSEFILTVGSTSKSVKTDLLEEGKHTLTINIDGNYTLQPSAELAGVKESREVDIVTLEPVTKENEVEGIRNTYITKVNNLSNKVTDVIVAPALHASLLNPTGNTGYVFRGRDEAWAKNPQLKTPLFIGSDLENMELVISTKNSSARLTPEDVKRLAANNMVTITKTGEIEIRPAE